MQGTVKFSCKICKKPAVVKGNVFPTSDGNYQMIVSLPYDNAYKLRWDTVFGDPICARCTTELKTQLGTTTGGYSVDSK